MSTDRMMAAVAATLLAVGVNMASAQHAPAPPHAPADKGHAESKPAGAKAAEVKPVETKRPPAAPATSPAAAVERILRKLSQDLAKAPAKPTRPRAAVSHAAPPRLQVAWRLSLTWPAELTPLPQ